MVEAIGQSGVVQRRDEFAGDAVSVGDDLAAAEAEIGRAAHQARQVRVQRRLTARHAQHPGPEGAQLRQPLVEHLVRNGRRMVVVLVAVAAGEVAPPDDDDVRQERAVPQPVHGGERRFGDSGQGKRGRLKPDLDHLRRRHGLTHTPGTAGGGREVAIAFSSRRPSALRARTSAPRAVSGMSCIIPSAPLLDTAYGL